MVCSGLAFFSWLFGWNETRAHVVDFSEVRADVQNLDFFMGLGLQNSRESHLQLALVMGWRSISFTVDCLVTLWSGLLVNCCVIISWLSIIC